MLERFHKKAFKTISSKDIINISQNTTERIEKIHLNDFFKNCINTSDQKININSKLFYTYFEKNNLYEIYFIENFSNKKTPLPFIFSEIHDHSLNEIFLYDEYFILYSKGNFILFKESSSEISSNDILNFILHRYEINIDKIHRYSKEEIDNLKDQYNSNRNKYIPPLIDLKKDKKLLSFFISTLFLLLIPLIHYNYFYNKDTNNYKIDKKLNSLEKRYVNLLEKEHKKKSKYLINTLLQIKNFNLKLQSINLNKNKIHLFIESKNKLQLLEFIDMYDGDIKINKLHFNTQNKSFNMEAMIVI